jgi:hypothetical protein
MSETIEVQIGGKPYKFVPCKERRIGGVAIRLEQLRAGDFYAAISTSYSYSRECRATAQSACDAAIAHYVGQARDALTYARIRESRSVSYTKRRVADLRKQIAQEQAYAKREEQAARRDLPKVEARVARALAAFGVK